LIILVVSLAVLAKSAEIVIDSATKLSNFFGISHVAIGFVFLSTITSLPELSVSINSSVIEKGALAAGNVFGSNVADILLVLGICAFLFQIRLRKIMVKDIILLLLGVSSITLFIIYSVGLGVIEGALLIAIFIAYVLYLLRQKAPNDLVREHITKGEAFRAFLWFCIGILFVMVSSGFAVNSGVRLAEALGVAKSFIGATLIAVGTSLPELSLELQAVRKKRYGLALGDALGSCITNTTLVLGVAALLNPVIVDLRIFAPMVMFALLTYALFYYLITSRKTLGRKEGAILLGAYLLFILTISAAQVTAH